MHSQQLFKGTLKTIILRLLSEHGKMYGYEISQKVKELTQNKIVITEGALYPTLHKLEVDGLLVTDTQNIGKRIRRYYSVTQSGKIQAESLANEFVEFVQTILLLLNPKLAKK